MLDTIITLFAIYGLTYAVKESSLLAGPRNWLMLRSVFLTKMLMCWFCSAFWASLWVLVLHQWAGMPGSILLWGLGGAAIGHLLNALYTRLTWIKMD